MKAIVLCGGDGKKMWPYNKYWQKCCLPVGNVPHIVRVVRQLQAAGVEEITLLAGYLAQDVRCALRALPQVQVAPCPAEQLGQGIAAAAGPGMTLVVYGDVCVAEDDLAVMVNAVREGKNTVLLEALDGAFSSRDYICALEEGGRVCRFSGHPRPHQVNAKVAGVFALDAALLGYAPLCPSAFLQVPVGGMPPRGFALEQCLQTALEDGHAMAAAYTGGFYADLDFPWDILAANRYCARQTAGGLTQNRLAEGAVISEGATVKGFVQMGKNSRIGERVLIEGNCVIGDDTVIDNGAVIGKNVLIGSGTTVRDYCKVGEDTVIGSGNRIGFSAEVAGVTFDGVSIVHGSEVFGVVGRHTDIAAGCTMGILRFDDMFAPQKVGAKRYGGPDTNAVFLGDHTRTGIGNLFVPGVKVGANTALGPGLVIDRDIAENKLVLVKQETVETSWGPERYGW